MGCTGYWKLHRPHYEGDCCAAAYCWGEVGGAQPGGDLHCGPGRQQGNELVFAVFAQERSETL